MPGSELREPPIAVQLNDLQPGDVLLFMTSKETCRIQKCIMALQTLSFTQSERGGHFDCTHAAICIGQDKEKGPMLAHISEIGYVRESLVGYDGDERAFMVFRNYNKDANEMISLLASLDSNKGLQWSYLAVLGTLFRLPRLDPGRASSDQLKSMTKKTICSKFVCEVLKNAARKRGEKEDILSTITPKSLESYLYYSPNYQMFTYLGKEPYQTLKAEIEANLQKINSPVARQKYDEIIQKIHTEIPAANEMYKILALLHVMKPVLKEFGRVKKVEEIARKRAIFDRDIENVTVEKVVGKIPVVRSRL